MTAIRRRLGAPALSLIFAAILPASGSRAAGPCYASDAFHTHLAERYGERPAGAGLAAGRLVELLTRPDGITWTILVIRPDGLACALVVGERWNAIDNIAPKRGEGP